jgi:hypothetical protein
MTSSKQNPSDQLRRGFTVTNIDALTVEIDKRERVERIDGLMLGNRVVWLDPLDTPFPVTYPAGTSFSAKYQIGPKLVGVRKPHESRWWKQYTLEEFAELFVPKHAKDVIFKGEAK